MDFCLMRRISISRGKLSSMGHMQGPTDPNHGLGSYFCIGLVKLNAAEAVALVLDGGVVAELQLHIKIKVFASSLLLRVLVHSYCPRQQ